MSDIFELPNTNDATLEEILDNTDNKHIFLSSDWHIMKYKYTKERNPVNTTEIIKWCKDNIKPNDVLFIPYFLDMEKRYMKGRVNYYLIYPSSNCKSDYIKRFKELGFANDQIDYLSDNWNDMIKDCKRYKNGIELSKNEYALDIIKNLIYSNIEESSLFTKEDLDYFNKYIK